MATNGTMEPAVNSTQFPSNVTMTRGCTPWKGNYYGTCSFWACGDWFNCFVQVAVVVLVLSLGLMGLASLWYHIGKYMNYNRRRRRRANSPTVNTISGHRPPQAFVGVLGISKKDWQKVKAMALRHETDMKKKQAGKADEMSVWLPEYLNLDGDDSERSPVYRPVTTPLVKGTETV